MEFLITNRGHDSNRKPPLNFESFQKAVKWPSAKKPREYRRISEKKLGESRREHGENDISGHDLKSKISAYFLTHSCSEHEYKIVSELKKERE